MTQLQQEILSMLGNGHSMPLQSIGRLVRATRHPSRVHQCLREMDALGLVLTDMFGEWAITNLGRKWLAMAEKVAA
jgi:DNA-binding IclR family transcriptional regulator